MKICPYCSGQLEDEDVKCRHCGEWIIRKRRRGGAGKKRRSSPKRVFYLVLAIVVVWGIYRVLESSDPPGGILDRRSPMDTTREDLESLVVLQEEYYQENGAHSGNARALGFEASEGVTVSITATPTGWSATATHEDHPSTEGCAVYGGTAVPPSSPVTPGEPGRVVCTE